MNLLLNTFLIFIILANIFTSFLVLVWSFSVCFKKRSKHLNTSIYLKNNKDDLATAIDGLNQFTHNFCMNCAETKEKNELVFNCSNCNFSQDGACLIKSFIFDHLSSYKDLPPDFGCMGGDIDS